MRKALVINNKVIAKGNQGTATITGAPPLSILNATEQNLISYSVYGKTYQESLLPEGYTELEYVTATGDSYINTGVYPRDVMKAETSMTLSEKVNAGYAVFGGRESAVNQSVTLWSYIVSNASCRHDLGNVAGPANVFNPELNTKYTIRLENKKWYWDNALKDATNASSFIGNYAVYLGALNTNDSANFGHKGNIYRTKFWQDGVTLSRDYIPAKRNSDSAIGFYDLVSNTFSASLATAFVAGPAYPSPTHPVEIQSVGKDILPDGYKQLEYIESSGTQYTDSNINLNSNIKAEVKVKFNNTSTNLIGTYSTTGRAQFGILTNGKWSVGIGSVGIEGDMADTNIHTFVLDCKNKICTKDSISTGDYSGATFSFANTQKFILFARQNINNIDYYSRANIYYCKIWDNDILVRNFLPAKRTSDSVIGMYDTVTSTFFTNAGTGNFAAGPEDTSCTVPVKVRKEIASGYTELEYIQSSGTQYIDTGIAPTHNTRVLYTAAVVDDISATDSHLFGSRTTASSKAFDLAFMDAQVTGTLRFISNSVNNDIQTALVTTQTIHNKINYEMSGTFVNINGNQVMTFVTTPYVGNYNLWIGAVNNAGTMHSQTRGQKVYGCYIWESNLLFARFIPAMRNSDNAIGMYEAVTGLFFTNAGTGNFTAGPIIGGVYDINLSAPLQKIGTYTDSIESDGTLTRAVGVKVFDGTEPDSDWQLVSGTPPNRIGYGNLTNLADLADGNKTGSCSHYTNHGSSASGETLLAGEFNLGVGATSRLNFVRFSLVGTDITTLAGFKSWLASQYAAGTPVTVCYPLASETETSVQVPVISIEDGDNIISVDTEINPSNMSVTYSTGSALSKVVVVEE